MFYSRGVGKLPQPIKHSEVEKNVEDVSSKYWSNPRISGKSLEKITTMHNYFGCSFYPGKDSYAIMNSYFDNCSFRGDIKFRNLKGSTFSNCGFSGKVIYEWIFERTQMRYNDLKPCNKEDFPKHMFAMPFLTDIRIANYYMYSICHGIGKIEKLQTLVVCDCGVEQVSHDLISCFNLKQLDLRGNNLNYLPRDIFFMPLQYLNISNNIRYTTLTSEFFRLTDLEYLDISGIEFEYISPEINKLQKLKKLVLDRRTAAKKIQELFNLSNYEDLCFLVWLQRQLPFCDILVY